ncbi:hypothetical protein ACRE_061760 [Hapsidospora chrysogenum ATCC 11550]|uniref:F-box domain-containing protein n=1 Tax=Hapsidospora chrysogenum (strain ATCC 11550 / CBS 779.69 / DSM 880 / IAM 14645 / JCM 23072 / IMI 49137) TaxID=857340 RepID=A0A086T130_HAPC1|nr:hypothetical protein ACRE_061760 [Hapsidospora chrysogenum ATCC 11550]
MARRPVRSGKGSSRVQATSVAPTPSSSTCTASLSSAYPSASMSEIETEDEVNKLSIASLTLDVPLTPFRRPRRVPPKPFPFLHLPSELRLKVYEHFFDDEGAEAVLDLAPDNYKRYHRKLGLMRVNRQLHDEATHYFYSTRTFRIFPTYPGRYFKTKRPLLARLKKNQRQCIQSLELRLGPGWNAPPRGWTVNDALGLADCTGAHTLRVFVECDPSDGVFRGFRRAEGFYERFSQNLMARVIEVMPAVNTVEFDAWSSVKKGGPMMSGLLDVARRHERRICWGRERGWTADSDDDNDGVIDERAAGYADGAPISFEGIAYNISVSA